MEGQTAHKVEEKPRTDDVLSVEQISFAGLLLSEPVLQGLTAAGFKRPSPIQLKAIPFGRCGLDLIVQAKSGTGKTCVFAVIALENVITEGSSCQVLVLAPTREIAVQIWEVINSIGSCMKDLRCYTFIGGLPVAGDKQKLKKCHIAIGTPGRVKQLIEEGLLNTESIRLFVLDEADKLLEDSFQKTINWIYSSLAINKQMLALSATYPEVLAQHLTAYMRNPTFVRLNTSDPALLGIRQYSRTTPFHPLPQKVFEEKSKVLMDLLSSVSFNQCLVFSNYQIRAQSLSDLLVSKGWPSTYISGSQDQQQRLIAMAKLKQFQCRVLISTDLTSRGIDAENVNLVVNLDIPKDHETYLHRIGRAGRFGSFGAAISLACLGKEMADLKTIEAKCNTHIEPLPDPVPNDLARSSGFIHIDDYVVAEKIMTVSSEPLCEKLRERCIDSIGPEEKSELLDEHSVLNGESKSLREGKENDQIKDCSVKNKARPNVGPVISLDVPDTLNVLEGAVTQVSQLLKSQTAIEENTTVKLQELQPERTQEPALAKEVDGSPCGLLLPSIYRGKSQLSASLKSYQDIIDHQSSFHSAKLMPSLACNEETLPGDRLMQVTVNEMEDSVNAIAQLLKSVSLERDGLLKENNPVTREVAHSHNPEDSSSTRNAHPCSNGLPPSIREEDKECRQSEVNTNDSSVPNSQNKIIVVPESLQTPLSIVIDDCQLPDLPNVEQDTILGMDYINRLAAIPDDDASSDDLTNISDLSGEESDTESESGSTDICSLVSEESGIARLPARNEVMPDATENHIGYPHNTFESVDKFHTENALYEPAFQEGDYIHPEYNNPDYIDSYSAEVQASHLHEPYYNVANCDYDSNDIWKQSLGEAVQYSQWLNNVHMSNYAHFYWQSYNMHKQYAEYYEELYKAADAQLKEL